MATISKSWCLVQLNIKRAYSWSQTSIACIIPPVSSTLYTSNGLLAVPNHWKRSNATMSTRTSTFTEAQVIPDPP
ncbi:hypothetical protein Pst134EA_032697 [Puccinia striiformis f. sp. tritici]|uniref:uncharacterized protein n=1 Tax=Puccinia striiformis f. sp. tritici TaxID=168172 RepID=UPI002008A88A|nr:uncharacterized protein Pst134EA_032697 [Puccinia striiformis f. sp. tritici]KAH9442027.1 hypothetical protein Pst134EB_028300 [Puccinia striiformis f. sp. tritici]KAH9443455.1 hypothetical protein Pst134EA_032697 [Puccinia striiformis f. sp. tritici]